MKSDINSAMFILYSVVRAELGCGDTHRAQSVWRRMNDDVCLRIVGCRGRPSRPRNNNDSDDLEGTMICSIARYIGQYEQSHVSDSNDMNKPVHGVARCE